MSASNGYAVFFFPPALEALGEAIKPYLHDGPVGPHVLCNEIDSGGSLLGMTIRGVTPTGSSIVLELMVPASMVRMIVSSQSDADFGFGPRITQVVDSLPLWGTGGSAGSGTDVDESAAVNDAASPGSAKTKPGKGKAKKEKPTKAKPANSEPAGSRRKRKPG